MENLALKIKLAVLWLFLAVGMSATTMVYFMTPGLMEEIMAGEMEGVPISEGLLVSAGVIYWLIPLTMAFLSLTLKDSANRWANIIVGIVKAGLKILDIYESSIQGRLALSLMSASMTVPAVCIVWYAWKWPKKEVVTKPEE